MQANDIYISQVIGTLSIILLLAISSCNVFSDENKIQITIKGTTVKSENGASLKDVKVVLFRTEPGIFREEEEILSETLSDNQGKFNLSAEINTDECDGWSYWVNAWLSIVIEPEVPRQIERELSIECIEANQELILELKPVD